MKHEYRDFNMQQRDSVHDNAVFFEALGHQSPLEYAEQARKPEYNTSQEEELIKVQLVQ